MAPVGVRFNVLSDEIYDTEKKFSWQPITLYHHRVVQEVQGLVLSLKTRSLRKLLCTTSSASINTAANRFKIAPDCP